MIEFGIILIFLVAVLLYIKLAPQFGSKARGEELNKMKESDNYVKGKFIDKEYVMSESKTDFSTLIKFLTKGDTIPSYDIPIVKYNEYFYKSDMKELTKDVLNPNVKITWMGHSTLLLDINNKKILLDPMLGDIASPSMLIGPKRFNKTIPIEIDDIEQFDAVIISHDHYDHLDYRTIIKIKNKVKMFFVPLGVGAHLLRWGVDSSKISELDWWESCDYEHFTFVATPSRHFSGRSLYGRNGTLWCSWVIRSNNVNIFFSGDGGYSNYFKAIGEKYGPFDLTMLECGQYNEGWADIHMMPEQTVMAHKDLKGKILLPIHWGAFKLSVHSWYEPVERLLSEADKMNVVVTTPKIGETIIINKFYPNEKWWH